jgi:ATP-dependent protease ClpP protease subunit
MSATEKKKTVQFPRTSITPSQSPKFWAKEKDRYLRQLLISDIQELTKRPLIVYFAQLDQIINHTDPDDLSEILSDIQGREADILIQTPGGNVDAAEKFISILKHKLDRWRVIVPSWAKSAGTVIALSSEAIVLGINSELGPIDPQWLNGGMSIPCEILSQDTNQPLHIRKMAEMAVQRSTTLARSLLKNGMMKGKSDEAINEVLKKVSTANGYNSHGAVIDYEEAISIGLAAQYLKPDDDLWKKIWLLYCLYDYDTKAKNIGRVIEGDIFSISRPK